MNLIEEITHLLLARSVPIPTLKLVEVIVMLLICDIPLASFLNKNNDDFQIHFTS